MKIQPKDIEKYCDEKEWRNYDKDGFTGKYVVSAKNIIDMLIDLKALNEPITEDNMSEANLTIPDVTHRFTTLFNMKTFYVIQDVKTKEYFWQYRIDEGFNADISSAKQFQSEGKALQEMQEEYLKEVFAERFLEIKKYYSLS